MLNQQLDSLGNYKVINSTTFPNNKSRESGRVAECNSFRGYHIRNCIRGSNPLSPAILQRLNTSDERIRKITRLARS